MAQPFSMTIDGRAVTSESEFAVTDPATGEVIARAPECSYEQLDEAMAAAEVAFREWRRDPEGRRASLLAGAQKIRHHADELATLLTTEQGKPLRDARAEVEAFAHHFDFYAEMKTVKNVLIDDGVSVRRGRAEALWRRGDHHAVEFPIGIGVVEDCAGPLGRQHRRNEAVAVHPALDAPSG